MAFVQKILSRVRRQPVEVVFKGRSVRRPIHGIFPIKLQLIPLPDSPATPLTVSIALDRKPLTEDLIAVDFNDDQNRWLRYFVNTHLIKDGKHTIQMVVRLKDRTIFIRDIHFIVANDSPLAIRVRDNMKRYGTQLLIKDSCDSRDYDFSDDTLIPWFDSPGAEQEIDRRVQAGTVDERIERFLRNFVRDGYAIIEEKLATNLIDNAAAEVKAAAAAGWEGYVQGSSQRLRHLHYENPALRQIWLNPLVVNHLEQIFESRPYPCQTLTYLYGSEQEMHQDSIHLTPFPAGYMCGVWVALEDIRPDSGEIIIYPGSHRLQRLRMKDFDLPKVRDENWKPFNDQVTKKWKQLILESGIQPITYRPERGAILIWHENLMHGGSARKDPELTRCSVVSHYFAEGVAAFYDSTGDAAYTETLDDRSRG